MAAQFPQFITTYQDPLLYIGAGFLFLAASKLIFDLIGGLRSFVRRYTP